MSVIQSIGISIIEQKSETAEKKRKKCELVFPPPGGTTGTVVYRLDATQILP